MKFWEKHKKLLVTLMALLASFLIICIYLFFDPFRDTVNLILIGFIIAYALKPLCTFICNKFKIKLKTSALIIVFILFLAVGGTAYFFIPTIMKESAHFGVMLDNLDQYVENLVLYLGIKDIEILNNLYEQLNEQLNTFISNLSPLVMEYLSSIFGSLMALAVIPVVAYYFLVDGDYLYNKILLILPTDKRIIFKKIFKNVDKVISRYIVSQFILSLIIAILTTIILLIFGVKFAVLLGIVNGVFNIIPYFGPIIGMIPSILVAFIQSPTTAIWTTVCIFGIQQIEGNILSPKITAESTDMHPITIIILLLIGEKIGGIIGMIIIVPIGVMIKVIYDDINYHLF